MTSLLCERRPGGSVDVHNSNIMEELVIDTNDNIETLYLPKTEARCHRSKMRRPQSTPNPRARQRTNLRSMDADALIGHTLKLQAWLNEKSVHSIQEKTDQDAKETKKMYDAVLETEDTFVKDLEGLVDHNEMLGLRRKEMLHKKWSEQVHRPITHQIDREMNGPTFTELARHKRELYRDYLEHVNRKGHVFLDTIAPDEYYPMSLHPVRPSMFSAETRSLRDPLLSQERQRAEEERVVIRCMTGSNLTDKDIAQVRLPPLPLVPLGRHGTECRTWLSMPMGDIESPVRQASRRRMELDSNNSHFNFEAWSKLPFDSAVVDEEMQTQKKRMFRQEPSFVFRSRSRSKQDVGVQVDVESY